MPEVTLADLEWADAILFGTPVRFGHPAPALMHFIDTTAALSIAVGLADKTDPVLFLPTNGSPYGASNVSRNQPGNVTEENLAAVEFQARRVLEVATALGWGRERTS